MKHLTLFAAAILVFVSCSKSDKQDTESTYAQPNIEEMDGVQRMSVYNYTDTVKWNGTNAIYTIHREAIDSLGTVTDDDGTVYQNNVLSVSVRRGGSTIFDRTFTKASIAPYVETSFMRRSVIEGAAFDRIDNGNMRMAISVGLPLSDEYVQLRLTISPNGSYSIMRDEVVDEIKAAEDTLGI